MDPTIILYGAMVLAGASKAREEEKKREDERKDRDKFWKDFHNKMDRTFERRRGRTR